MIRRTEKKHVERVRKLSARPMPVEPGTELRSSNENRSKYERYQVTNGLRYAFSTGDIIEPFCIAWVVVNKPLQMKVL